MYLLLQQVGGAKYEFMASSLLFSPRMYVCERATASSTLWRLQLSRASTLHSETRGQRYHYSKCITSWNYDSSGKVKIIGFKIDENPDSDGMPWFGITVLVGGNFCKNCYCTIIQWHIHWESCLPSSSSSSRRSHGCRSLLSESAT